MLVRDIDRKLDMRLVLKLRQNTDFFRATKDLNRTLPVYIFGKNDTTWMSTHFPKIEGNQKIELVVKKFDGIEKENSYVVDSRINNVKDLAIINKLMDVPSFIVNRSDVSGGYLNVYARFHSAHLMKVSHLLAEYTADSENSRVNWLGPSMGIISITDLINSEYPLSLVAYRVPFIGEDKLLSSILNEPGVIAELRNNSNKDGKLSAVLYCDHNIEGKFDGVTPISVQDGVYEMEISNVFHSMVREAANNQHIMRTRYFLKPRGESAELNVFLPSNSVYEYYSILYSIARQHKDDIVVSTLMPYAQEVWDFV